MCGRYRRRSDKQRIAEAFHAYIGLEDLYLDAEDEISPGSIQPVIRMNPDGERQIEKMRWGFKLPDRLLFNARSESIEKSNFWRESFQCRRCIVPADSFYEWQKVKTGTKPKYEFSVLNRMGSLEKSKNRGARTYLRHFDWRSQYHHASRARPATDHP